MKIGGVMTQSQGYPVDDDGVMTLAVLASAIRIAKQEKVDPVGDLTVYPPLHTVVGPDDVGIKWELEVA